MKAITAEIKKEHQQIINEILNFENIIKVSKPATLNDGIRKLNKNPRKRFLRKFEKIAAAKSFCNFIPASGSGSRMFKEVIDFNKNFNPNLESFSSFVNRTKSYVLKDFFFHIKKLPFYNEIPESVFSVDYKDASHDRKKLLLANYLIKVLEIQDKPKALQTFHSIDRVGFTALEQQYKLHTSLAKNFKYNELHFTINKKNQVQFEEATVKIGGTNDSVQLSHQSPHSNALCLDKYNNIFIKEDGSPLSKPSGHGALLDNLNMVEADTVHIHNIDNIPQDKLHKKIAHEKEISMGYLFFIEAKVHRYLTLLEQGLFTKKRYKKFKSFCRKHLQVDFKEYLKNSTEGKMSTIYQFLNRPIRVCGMVLTNESKGGGPYWIEEENGQRNLQIVESIEISQIPQVQ